MANQIYPSAVSSVLCIITQFTLAYLLILVSVFSLLALNAIFSLSKLYKFSKQRH